ncbi:MAG TPA: hypothetical protein VJ327_10945 [Patescibacteria group bacterium]|nr:hypothetical protein [Patescibacteria group bacterium]
MSYITPKTNWDSENVGDGDLIRIEENIRIQHQGGGIADGGSLTEPTPDSDYELDIGSEYDTFLFDPPVYDPENPEAGGLITIHAISTTGRSASNKIVLINIGSGIVVLSINEAPSSGYAAIKYSSSTYSIAANESAMLVYSGNYWYIVNNA